MTTTANLGIAGFPAALDKAKSGRKRRTKSTIMASDTRMAYLAFVTLIVSVVGR